MREETQTISFRVPANIARKLEEAGLNESMSRSEYARRLVLTSLGSATTNELLNEIQDMKRSTDELASQILRLRESAIERTDDMHPPRESLELNAELITKLFGELHESLATAVVVLLVKAASVDADQAKRWATTNLLRKPKTE